MPLSALGDHCINLDQELKILPFSSVMASLPGAPCLGMRLR